MIAAPKRAMVLAAGFGTRLRPITDHTPKPLVQVRGRALIDFVLDRLAAAGVTDAVVNTHHLHELIEAHLKNRNTPRVHFSYEKEILETGGGIRKALPLLGPDPFYAVNGKIIWMNGKDDALLRLATAFDPEAMDALLLLQSTVTAVGYDGAGDFFLQQDGQVRRRNSGEVAPFLFSGVQILHPRLFDGAPSGFFSLNRLYDQAIEKGRLFALRHDGLWFHVSTPRHLAEVEAALG